jgi:hypothetical protein
MDVKQTRAEVKAARGRIMKAVAVLLGSRATAAIALMFAIAFAGAAMATPEKLPPFGDISLAAIGLPQNLEFGKEKEVFNEALAAAQRQGGEEQAKGFFEQNRQVARFANWIGLVLAIVVFGWGVRQQSRLWKRGVRPF